MSKRHRFRWSGTTATLAPINFTITDSDLALLLVTTLDSISVRRLFGSYRLRAIRLYVIPTITSVFGVGDPPRLSWAPTAGARFIRESYPLSYGVGTASLQEISLVPPKSSLLADWCTTDTNTVWVNCSIPASTSYVFEIDLDFTMQLDDATTVETVSLVQTTRVLNQRTVGGMVPSGYAAYVP
jgi:hypothetical protein